MPASGLNNLTRRTLQRLAGERYFTRGEAYFREGRVRGLAEYKGQVTAKVRGTEDYRVKLWVGGDDINYSCSCPLGDDQEFCKHCAAVGLAWIEEFGGKSKKNSSGKKSATTMEDVHLFLERQNKSWLIDILLNEVMESDSLRERLFLEAARSTPERIDLATYRQAIKKAISVDDFVDYYSAHAYAQGIRRMIKAIDKLLDDGFAAETIELSEYALTHLEKSLGLVDDSDGRIGSCISELQELHHRACRKAHPDPVALARKLFEWEMHSDWEIFSGALETYADVLGQKRLEGISPPGGSRMVSRSDSSSR